MATNDFDIELSRRKALAALSTIGVGSAGAGLGTSAFFTDKEMADNNTLVAGELDLHVGYETYYADWSDDEDGSTTSTPDDDVAVRMYDGPAGTTGTAADLEDGEAGLPTDDAWLVAVDDREQFLANTQSAAEGTANCVSATDVDDLDRPVIDLDDVKPGDFGLVSFEFALCDNPGYVWLDAVRRAASESGTTEPEADDPDEGPGVELLDVARAAVWVSEVDGDVELLETGSLREVLATDPATDSGTFLNAPANDAAADGGGSGSRSCFAAEAPHETTFAWWVPVDHGNEIQTDSVTFDIGLYTEQCRHNDGIRERGRGQDLFDTEPFVDQPSPGRLTLTASEQPAGSTAIAELPPTAVAPDPGVELLSLSVSFSSPAGMDVTIDTNADPPATLPDRFASSGTLSITHPSPPDDAISEVRFGVAVDRDRIEDPSRFAFLRYDPDRGWLPVRAAFVSTTPTAYHYDVVSPGFSVFAAATIAGSPAPVDGARIVLPDGDPRPDPEISAAFTDDDAIAVDGIEIDPDLGPVVDVSDANSDEYPVTVSDAFRITNESDAAVGFSLSTTSSEIELRDDAGLFPVLSAGQTASISVRIRPSDPDNQLWASLGVPTLTEPDSDRPIYGSQFPGAPTFPCCTNDTEGPVAIPKDVATPGDNPDWLPDAADSGSKLHYRVPAVLNVRQVGDISDRIAVTIPTVSGPTCPNEPSEGALIAVSDRSGEVGNPNSLSGLGFTFDPAEFTGESLTRELDLIFVSNDVCDSGTDESSILDEIGDLTIEVLFPDDESEWADVTGADDHRSEVPYYTPGSSLVQLAVDTLDEAINTWASKTVAAVFPGGPVRMYRVVRAVAGAAPLAGPATALMAIWQGVNNLPDTGPLTATAILQQPVVAGVIGGSADLSANEYPNFFPGISNVSGVSDTEIGLYGPTLYFSDATDADATFETVTTENADATVVSDDLSGDGELEFRVFKCNTARAELSLGRVDSLDIGFDYESRRTGSFWEIPFVQVTVDGETVLRERFAPNGATSSRTGRFETSIPRDGEVTVEFGIEPSRFCGNSDHADTLFTVSNLLIDT